MALIMRDSTDPGDIPLDGLAAVAGYADGKLMWTSDGWARFPASIVRLSIVVSAADVGDILDVEPGCAEPPECPGWADRFNRPNRRRPTIYCNRGTIEAVRQAMGSRPFDWWVATLDGTKDVPGAVAVQYCGAANSKDPCRTSGHYDETVILDPSWIGPTITSQEDDVTPEELRQALRDVLNEATAPGQVSGAGTIQETLQTTQKVFNEVTQNVLPKLAEVEARLEQIEKRP
jgi:hypothetical protein